MIYIRLLKGRGTTFISRPCTLGAKVVPYPFTEWQAAVAASTKIETEVQK